MVPVTRKTPLGRTTKKATAGGARVRPTRRLATRRQTSSRGSRPRLRRERRQAPTGPDTASAIALVGRGDAGVAVNGPTFDTSSTTSILVGSLPWRFERWWLERRENGRYVWSHRLTCTSISAAPVASYDVCRNLADYTTVRMGPGNATIALRPRGAAGKGKRTRTIKEKGLAGSVVEPGCKG